MQPQRFWIDSLQGNAILSRYHVLESCIIPLPIYADVDVN